LENRRQVGQAADEDRNADFVQRHGHFEKKKKKLRQLV
jgi:hypothetical protein